VSENISWCPEKGIQGKDNSTLIYSRKTQAAPHFWDDRIAGPSMSSSKRNPPGEHVCPLREWGKIYAYSDKAITLREIAKVKGMSPLDRKFPKPSSFDDNSSMKENRGYGVIVHDWLSIPFHCWPSLFKHIYNAGLRNTCNFRLCRNLSSGRNYCLLTA
jgi:hypothetical protein